LSKKKDQCKLHDFSEQPIHSVSDWCLTSTLAVFQPYRGVNKFYYYTPTTDSFRIKSNITIKVNESDKEI